MTDELWFHVVIKTPRTRIARDISYASDDEFKYILTHFYGLLQNSFMTKARLENLCEVEVLTGMVRLFGQRLLDSLASSSIISGRWNLVR
jgi:hypothetical protein